MQRGRPRHDDILTPREWEVLALVEAGLTNEEIAERLGISFGTAKYHVAEIISKLGAANRDEAPAAARRARTSAPALAWLRGRYGLPVLGAAAATLVALLVSLAVFTDVLRTTSSNGGDETSRAAADFEDGDATSQADLLTRAPAQLSSFYYKLESTSHDPLMPEGQLPMHLYAEVWHAAPDKWRVHYFGRDGELFSVHVTDGETFWHFRALEGSYSRQQADPSQPITRPLFGPWPSKNLKDFMEDNRDGPASYWDVAEQRESILGIDTVRLVRSCCRQGVVDQLIGSRTYWFDPTYLFLLRMEEKSHGTDSTILHDIISVEYNPDLDPALFVFEPPAGAREAQAP